MLSSSLLSVTYLLLHSLDLQPIFHNVPVIFLKLKYHFSTQKPLIAPQCLQNKFLFLGMAFKAL